MPSTPTVSKCAHRSSDAAAAVPAATATALAGPGAASSTRRIEPRGLRASAGQNAAISASPAPPGTSGGVDRVDLDQAGEELGSLAHVHAASSATAGRPGSGAAPGGGGGRAGRRRRPGAAPAASSRSRPRRRPPGTGSGCPPTLPRPGPRRSRTGATTTISGPAAETSSHVTGNDGPPVRPSTSRPPASATISGTQCPAANGGSSHSATNTGTGGRPRPASAAARSCRASARRPRPPPRPRRAEAPGSATVPTRRRRSCAGRGEITSASRLRILPTSSLETAQTWHRSCVMTTSGASSRISSSSTA